MNIATSQPSWKRWLKWSRLVPFLTIIGAGTALVLSLLSILKLTVPESIIISLLALLSIDSLIERTNILERLEHRLNNLSSDQLLKKRVSMPRPNEQAQYASEICILGVSAHFAIPQYRGFYEKKIRTGCKLRVILLDPASPSLENWKLLSKSTLTTGHIEGTLSILKELMQKPGMKGKCEVRLSKVYYPFSIFAVDMKSKAGSMVVEFYPYDIPIDDRPHIQLAAASNPDWFIHFKEQFESAWSDARVYND